MRGIGNLLIGGIFIAGGLSGQMVLIGTNSPGALAGVGALLAGWGLFQMMQGSGGGEPVE